MCSTIILGHGSYKFLAENYDPSLDHGLIATNLKGTIKENGRRPGEKVLRWQVKYGSITFNQFSLELPVSGMNEKGLAVALMWHYEGNFGDNEQYTRLSALQWIQYQLDNFQNIAEVLEGIKTIRPKQESAPLHYTLLDAEGNCLLLEFLDGKPLTYVNPEYPILTNTTYQTCLDAAKFHANRTGFPDNSSVARFVHLFRQYSDLTQRDATASTGFELLQSVNQTPVPIGCGSFPWNNIEGRDTFTAWSIVFSPHDQSILFITEANKSIRELRMADFSFEKESEYRLMNINDGIAGNAAAFFRPYSKECNLNIVKRTAKEFQMPEPQQNELVNVIDHLYRQREMSLG